MMKLKGKASLIRKSKKLDLTHVIVCVLRNESSKLLIVNVILSLLAYTLVSKLSLVSTLWWNTLVVVIWCGIFNVNLSLNDVPSKQKLSLTSVDAHCHHLDSMHVKFCWPLNISTAKASFTVIWNWTTFCLALMVISRLQIMVCARKTCGLVAQLAHSVVHLNSWHLKSCWSKSMDELSIGGLLVSWFMKCCLVR